MRLPPQAFDYKSPKTEAWNTSFTVEGQRLANRLSIISLNRLQELKHGCITYSFRLKSMLGDCELTAKVFVLNVISWAFLYRSCLCIKPHLPRLVSTYTWITRGGNWFFPSGILSLWDCLHTDLMTSSTLHSLHFTITVIIHRQHTLLHWPFVKLLFIPFNHTLATWSCLYFLEVMGVPTYVSCFQRNL